MGHYVIECERIDGMALTVVDEMRIKRLFGVVTGRNTYTMWVTLRTEKRANQVEDRCRGAMDRELFEVRGLFVS